MVCPAPELAGEGSRRRDRAAGFPPGPWWEAVGRFVLGFWHALVGLEASAEPLLRWLVGGVPAPPAGAATALLGLALIPAAALAWRGRYVPLGVLLAASLVASSAWSLLGPPESAPPPSPSLAEALLDRLWAALPLCWILVHGIRTSRTGPLLVQGGAGGLAALLAVSIPAKAARLGRAGAEILEAARGSSW